MTILIDARTSQNASFSGSIAIPILAVNTPQLIGQIGLVTAGVGSNPRVQLEATVAIQLPILPVTTTAIVTIVRGTQITDPIIYSASQSLNLDIVGPQILTAVASDFQPPLTAQLTYTLFISVSVLGTIRTGPESLNGTLYSD